MGALAVATSMALVGVALRLVSLAGAAGAATGAGVTMGAAFAGAAGLVALVRLAILHNPFTLGVACAAHPMCAATYNNGIMP